MAASIPPLIYGTAWKYTSTTSLIKQALLAGFRGIDTAAQPKHYREDLVGAGIRDVLTSTPSMKRADLYIQTKYTPISGQDPKAGIPYDPNLSITDQVHASIKSSLHNLRPISDSTEGSYLDCLVLHSPFPKMSQTQEAWTVMESHVPREVRSLGISNCCDLAVLRELHGWAKVKPVVVQNRFYSESGYDRDVRKFCDDNDIKYQSFWTLTANPHLLRSEPVGTLAREAGVSRAVALYGFVLGLGNVSVLNGTKTQSRMEEDLTGVEAIKQWSEANETKWKQLQGQFKTLLE